MERQWSAASALLQLAGRNRLAAGARSEPMTRNFTVGPVTIEAEMRAVLAEPLPYFRDEAFGEVVRRVDAGLCALLGGDEGTRAALLTASGTGAMEAAVINLFGPGRRALVIEGGSFGRRFVEICEVHGIDHEVLRVAPGRDLELGRVREALTGGGFFGLLVQAHETSTGQRFDIQGLGTLCREAGALLVVDAISSVLADPMSMAAWNVAALVVSSNKGLALAPGLSAVVMGEAARAELRDPASLYLRLRPAFENAERGMTPYTPAIGVIRQLDARLARVAGQGGPGPTIAELARRASRFRAGLAREGIATFPQTPSNYLTALALPAGTSRPLYERLRARGFWINPSTWGFEHDVPKICHAGDLDDADHDALLGALREELGAGRAEVGT